MNDDHWPPFNVIEECIERTYLCEIDCVIYREVHFFANIGDNTGLLIWSKTPAHTWQNTVAATQIYTWTNDASIACPSQESCSTRNCHASHLLFHPGIIQRDISISPHPNMTNGFIYTPYLLECTHGDSCFSNRKFWELQSFSKKAWHYAQSFYHLQLPLQLIDVQSIVRRVYH